MLFALMSLMTKAQSYGWVDITTNGDCEGDDASCWVSKSNTGGQAGALVNVITPGVGVGGSNGIEVVSAAGAAEDWDAQFWIAVPEALPEGSVVKVSFDYKASSPVTVDTQAHGNPGSFQHWLCIGSPSFTTEWQTYSYDLTVSAEMAGDNGLKSIAFNLAKDRANDVKFYFDNLSVKIEKEIPEPAPTVKKTSLDLLPFCLWSSGLADAYWLDNAYHEYSINKSTYGIYGTIGVEYDKYVDLSDYSKLVVVTTSGDVRICLNRTTDFGRPEDCMIEFPTSKTQSDKYFTVKEANGSKTVTVNLEAINADYGFVHLNAITAAKAGDKVTVSELYVEREAGEVVDLSVTPTLGNVEFTSAEGNVVATADKLSVKFGDNVDASYAYYVLYVKVPVVSNGKMTTEYRIVLEGELDNGYAEFPEQTFFKDRSYSLVIDYIGAEEPAEFSFEGSYDGAPTLTMGDPYLFGEDVHNSTVSLSLEDWQGVDIAFPKNNLYFWYGSTENLTLCVRRAVVYVQGEDIPTVAEVRDVESKGLKTIKLFGNLDLESGKTYRMSILKGDIYVKDASGNPIWYSPNNYTVTIKTSGTSGGGGSIISDDIADGDYYIRNVEANKFLNGAQAWGTKASVTGYAQLMTLKRQDDGTYTIDTHYSNGGNKHFLGKTETSTSSEPAKPYTVVGNIVDPANSLDGKILVITNAAGTSVLSNYTTKNQDIRATDLATCDLTGVYFYNKFTKVNDVKDVAGELYTIQMCDANGDLEKNWWNPCYLNCTTWGAYFQLGLQNQYGQDGKYLALWIVADEGANGYSIKNAANGMYLDPASGGVSANKVYVNLGTGMLNKTTTNYSTWCDSENPANVTIKKTDDGYFTLKSDGYLRVDGNSANFRSGVATPSAKWELISANKVGEYIAGASEDAPKAVPVLVDGGFGRNNTLAGGAWQGTDFSKGCNGDGNNYYNHWVAEKWGGNSDVFDVYQTVKVPNGKYMIRCNGFYRYNNTTNNTNDVAKQAHADGSEVINSVVYANNVSVPLKSIADEASVALNGGKMPFSMGEASQAFSSGAYINELYVEVTDGELTVGIKKENHPGCDWTIWDSFEIYSLGVAIDPSAALVNGDFALGKTGWDFTTTGNNWSDVLAEDPKVVEAYAGWGNLDLTDFSVSQKVKLPAGTYTLSAYGFYRYGVSYDVDPSKSCAKLFAGNNSVDLVTLGSIKVDNYANDVNAASAAFKAGQYLNELTFTMAKAGEIELGVKGAHELKQSWLIVGPFTLKPASAAARKPLMLTVCDNELHATFQGETDVVPSYKAAITVNGEDVTNECESSVVKFNDVILGGVQATPGTTYDVVFEPGSVVVNGIKNTAAYASSITIIGEATSINGVAAESVAEGIYTVSGAKVNTLQRGINIVRNANGKAVKVLVK